MRAARFTTGFLRLVGQEPAPSKCFLMSTSGITRIDMRDQWSVKLDLRYSGRHLDTTHTGWSATLVAGVLSVFQRPRVVAVFPLDFHGRFRVVRTTVILGAVHGVEASLLFQSSLVKLRSALVAAVWSQVYEAAMCPRWFNPESA